MNKIILLFVSLVVLVSTSWSQQTEEGRLFRIKQNGKYGYMDNTGNIVIEPQFYSASGFSEGLAKVGAGLIDKTGKIVIKLQGSFLGFSEGLAGVKIGKKLGYIDKIGQYVWEPTK